MTTIIRRPGLIDADNVRRMSLMAHPKMDKDMLDGMRKKMIDGVTDGRTLPAQLRRTGEVVDVPVLFSARVLAEADAEAARAYIYCAPPADWAFDKSHSPLPPRYKMLTCRRLFEVNLLATLPQHRRRGYASLLLADAEQRYAAAGYGAAVVVVNREQLAAVRPWYEARGYAFAAPDVPGPVRWWSQRSMASAYHHLIAGQSVGFKALHPAVSVLPGVAGGPPTLVGLLDVPDVGGLTDLVTEVSA